MRRFISLVSVSAALLGVLAAPALAQEDDLAEHPCVGAWMTVSTLGTAFGVFSPEGTVVTAPAPSRAGPQGVTFGSARVGTWEATGEASCHLTIVQLLSDAEGAFTGSLTVDANQTVSPDGQTFNQDEGTTITIRDAEHNVVDVITDPPPAVGTRMNVGSPGFPEASPAVASPTP